MAEVDYSKHIRRVDDEPQQNATNVADNATDDVAVRPDMVQESGFLSFVKSFFGGDKVLWVIIIALMTISVLVVYSSTAKMAYNPRSAATTMQFLKTQFFTLGISIVALCIAHRLNSAFYRKWVRHMFWLAVLATLAVYFTGQTTNGAARWISIFGFQFQPSEMLKLCTVAYLALALAKRQSTIRTLQIVPSMKFWTWNTPKQIRIIKEGFIPLFLPIIIACLVIFPAHTSSAVLVFGMSLVMLYIGRVRWVELFRILKWALVGVAFVFVLGLGRSHTAGGRVSTWIEVWTTDRTEVDVDELSDTERSMIAIHNGGIMGRGAGQSAVRVEMTHPESDYAFAFFVEEYGLGLSIILIALYVWIFFRAIEIFERCPKKFPAMLSLGVALLITMQALLHLMVTVNIIPETGQTLPLISRGGSSMLFTSIGLGIILSVSRQNAEGSYGDEQ